MLWGLRFFDRDQQKFFGDKDEMKSREVSTRNILLSWIGDFDLQDPARPTDESYGAITSILTWQEVTFDVVHLLSNRDGERIRMYIEWLKSYLQRKLHDTIKVEVHFFTDNPNPTDYQFIYQASDQLLRDLDEARHSLFLNLTSGTPAMCATWLLLGRGVYGATLLQTSKARGIERVSLPYDVSLQAKQDYRLIRLSERSPDHAYFDHIPAQSAEMQQVIQLAKLLAPRDVPLIIQGETGTGKEVMAQAIHAASKRKDGPFIAVNCGAIPESLVDAEFFGHAKGAFTNADKERKGYFESAHNGTLFLDELGELSLSVQVKLLRVLQQGEILRIGESLVRKVNVRVIAATHRDLLSMVENGTFREDLFYRLAIGIIHLPSLRERTEDIPQLCELLLKRINDDPVFASRRLSANALAFIKKQAWLGNIRELDNTLLRATAWNPNVLELGEEHLRAALIQRRSREGAVDVRLSGPVDIYHIINEMKLAYVEAALEQCDGNKSQAARLLGLKNSQTLENWRLKKFE